MRALFVLTLIAILGDLYDAIHFIYEETEQQKATEQCKNLNTPMELTVVGSDLINSVFFGKYASTFILRLRIVPLILKGVWPTVVFS